MSPLKGYSLDYREEIKNLEIKGEKVTFYFRWFFIAIVFIILTIYYTEHSINNRNIFFISFAVVPLLYNLFLQYIFIKNKYKPFIKYLSMFIDTTLISIGIFISSYAYSLLYTITAPTVLVYSAILALSITRIDSMFVVFSTLYTVISLNTVYILWFKTFSNTIDYSLMMSLGYTHQQQIRKSIFLIILGFISYYTVSVLKKFIYSTIEASTKARNAEKRLIKQYQIILNNLNIGVSIIDTKNTVIFINQPLIDMLGYNRNDIIGKNLLELIIPDEKKRNKKTFHLIKNKVEQNRYLQIKLSLTAKSGEIIPVQIFIAKTHILNDPAYLLTISDLRKQKALEKRLLQSRKMETIGRMASGFAHDFNNLISIINEYLYNAKEEKDDLDIGVIEKINSVVNRQKELVDLLYRISGKIEESEVKLSIKSLFSKIIGLLSPILPDGISLNMKSYIDDNTLFTVNETAILQIIFNLILNAKEAIEPNKGKIDVSASITKEHDKTNAVLLPNPFKNQSYLMFTISDNGPGIPNSIINRIFDPYVSTKLNRDSLRRGLGLSFVYTITEQLNGGISIFTKRGEGTTFKIYIPTEIYVKDSENTEIEKKGETGYSENTGKTAGSEEKVAILYIDDDEDMRTITSKILNRHGFKVRAVKNGIDALNLLKNDRYNLIMTDYYLPDIEGDKLVLKLKEHSNSPIILITGVQVDNIKKIEGVHAVIKKPIEVDVLLKTIKNVVNT